MNLSCTKCGSEHTQKLSSVYASGTRHGHSTSYTSGMVVDNAGNVGGMSGTTSTSATYRSELAERIAPPKRLSVDFGKANPIGLISMVIAWFVTTMVAMSIDQMFFKSYKMVTGIMGSSDPVRMAIDHTGTCMVIGFLGSIFVFYLMVRGSVKKAKEFEQYNKAVYEPAIAEWQLKYYCHRCDTIFKPNT
jgi:hypothetical protein